MNKLELNFDLKNYNSLKIQTKCKYFIEINNYEKLKYFIEQKYFIKNKFVILGSGTNILFTQDFFDGIVLKNNFQSKFSISDFSNHFQIKASSGFLFDELIQKFLEHQTKNEFVFGLENLAKIPGNIGSAVVQNIGAYGIEQQNFFQSCEAINLLSGETKIFDKIDCNFDYRTSIFKQNDNPYFITEVIYSIDKSNSYPKLNYLELNQKIKSGNEISPQKIYATVSNIRENKLPNLEEEPNCGSFFKNPLITKNEFNNLKLNFPNIVSYSANSDDFMKISAAWLIENCDFKGKKFGNVGMHVKHSLILVNYDGKASGQEIIDFANLVIKTVEKKFGITLQPEVVYV